MYNCCGSIVVSTLPCGLNNQGSNPAHGISLKSSEDTFEPNSRGVRHFFLASIYDYENNSMYFNNILVQLGSFFLKKRYSIV